MTWRAKLILFIGLWHELAAQFAWGMDKALLAALALALGSAWLRMRTLDGFSHPLVALFVWGGAMWLVLYAWLAPAAISSVPVSLIVIAIGLVMLAGYYARLHFEQNRENYGKAWLRERSEEVVILMLAGVAGLFLARREFGSVLPVAGVVAIFALPFSFGWIAALPVASSRHDARFGDEKMFRDAGVSGDY